MTVPPEAESNRARLAAKLREVLAATDMSASEFASHIGWPRSRVSKIVTGTQVPSDQDVADWLEAAQAEDQQGAVEELLARAKTEHLSFRKVVKDSGSADALQHSAGQTERQATQLSDFLPTMVPGLLQTPAYARAVLSAASGPAALGATLTETELDRLVALRIERQTILYEGNKDLSFIVGEAALWTRMGSIDTQRGQLDRLHAIAELNTLKLGIVPFSTAMPVFPLHGFRICDNETVRIESFMGGYTLSDPEEVATYVRFFSQLQDTAVVGREAAQLIRHVSRQLSDEQPQSDPSDSATNRKSAAETLNFLFMKS